MRTAAKTNVIPMLTVEIAVYVALAVLGVIAGFASIEPIMVVGVVVLLVAFIICTPLRDDVAGRIIAGAAGLEAIKSDMKALIEPMRFPEAARYVLGEWLACVAALLVVLVVTAFVRQMVRGERSHLIRGLSHTVFDGIAMVAGTGWFLLPQLFGGEVSPVGGWPWIAALLVVLVVVVAFGVASVRWLDGMDPSEHAVLPWVGVALLPVMLVGALVPVLSLVLALI